MSASLLEPPLMKFLAEGSVTKRNKPPGNGNVLVVCVDRVLQHV